MNVFENIMSSFGYERKPIAPFPVYVAPEPPAQLAKVPSQIKDKTAVTKPAGRVSKSEYHTPTVAIREIDGFVTPPINPDVIPIIRQWAIDNEDVGAVYNDLIQLTNTGHHVIFDQSIDSDVADKMKVHLTEVTNRWGNGVPDISGLVNKWIGQIWISGALSNEWVVARDFSGVTNNVIVNPENIRFKYDPATTRYKPWQLIKNGWLTGAGVGINAVELNTNTYSYNGILSNTDSPYGIPPFITALCALETQTSMKKNINHILYQLGLLGYLEVKISKPDQQANESIEKYTARLNSLLLEAKGNVIGGFNEGVVVGFEEDHEFEFHSTTKNLGGVTDIFNQNEVQIANGLKSSPSFIGQKSSGTETNMSIVFTKMLSQLKNIQDIISQNLQTGYLLELQLAGFQIKRADITVKFNASTITDDLKSWQAKEIKQRVVKALRVDNIISQDTYAEEMGYRKPNGPEPIVPYQDQVVGSPPDEGGDEADKNTKNKSARRSRDTTKKQPKRKDTNPKPQ